MGDLSLQWDDHSSIFVEFVSSLHGKNRFADATIACNGQLYPVHKFVLSVCSNYLNTIFEDTNAAQQHPVLILKDISPDVLEALLKYIYLGKVNIENEKYADLISAAKSLKIKGLDVPSSQNKSGDEEEIVVIERSSSSLAGHGSVTEEKDSKQGSPSCQNHLLDSCLVENTTSSAVPGGGLNSNGAPHDHSLARGSGGKARRGRPVSYSSKRSRSQIGSGPGFPPAKRSSLDQLSQPSPLPNPFATTAEPLLNNPDAATGPSLLNFPADLQLDVASIAPLKHEMLTGVPKSHLSNAPLPVIVEAAIDPRFPSLQSPACQQQQQQPRDHPEPVSHTSSSSLRSFRLPGRTLGARQPPESRLANIRVVPEDHLINTGNPKPVDLSNSSSLPKIRVIPEEKLLPSKNAFTKVRIVPESRLCWPSLSGIRPEAQASNSWEGCKDEKGENQTLSHSGGEPSKSWELSSSSSSQLNLPIITSCYSVLPSTSEHSPSTLEATDQPHLPLLSLNSVDPQPASFETSPQTVQSQQIGQLGMELSVGGPPTFIQPPSEVTFSRHDASQDPASLHVVQRLEMALEGNRPSPSSPIKPCSVKLTRLSPNKSDSVNVVCKSQTPKSKEVFECSKCSFLTPSQTDFLKHTNNSCSQEELPVGSVSEQNCSGLSKLNVSAGDNNSEVSLLNSTGETSSRNSENPDHPGKVFNCKLCFSKFQKENCLIEHQKLHTESKKFFKCPHCEYLTTSSSRLRHHLEKRKPNALNRCKYCNFTACTDRLIKNHLGHKLDDKEEKLDVDVPVVDAKFKKKDLDSSKKVKKYSCHTCQGVFLTYSMLTKHELQTGHGSDKPFRCDLCEFRSVSQGAVKNHMRRHLTKATYMCMHCSYSCEVKRALDKHLLVDHRTMDPANVCSPSIAGPLKPAVLEEAAADAAGGSQAMECNISEPLSNESENSIELGLSFNVEEFQKECLNKLLSDKKIHPISNQDAAEIKLLSDTEKHQENSSLDEPLTLKAKSIEIPVNSISNPEEASSSDHILSQPEKQAEYDGHQFKHTQVSRPAGILYSPQNQEDKMLNSSLVQAEQKDELLNRPLARHEHGTELPGRPLSGKDQRNEELSKPLAQHGYNKQKDCLQSHKNQKIGTVNRALGLHLPDDELLGSLLSVKDQESKALNIVLSQHGQDELGMPPTDKQLKSGALNKVLPQQRHDELLDRHPSEKQLESEASNNTFLQQHRHELFDRPPSENQLESEALNKVLPQYCQDELLGRPMSEKQLESEALNKTLAEQEHNNGLQERPLQPEQDKPLGWPVSQPENRDE